MRARHLPHTISLVLLSVLIPVAGHSQGVSVETPRPPVVEPDLRIEWRNGNERELVELRSGVLIRSVARETEVSQTGVDGSTLQTRSAYSRAPDIQLNACPAFRAQADRLPSLTGRAFDPNLHGGASPAQPYPAYVIGYPAGSEAAPSWVEIGGRGGPLASWAQAALAAARDCLGSPSTGQNRP